MINVSEAKLFLSILMMIIGVVPVLMTYLDIAATKKAKTYSLLWMCCWWAIPVFSMARFILSN